MRIFPAILIGVAAWAALSIAHPALLIYLSAPFVVSGVALLAVLLPSALKSAEEAAIAGTLALMMAVLIGSLLLG